MKKFIIFALLLTAFANYAVNAQTEAIVWEKDFKKAQALARKTGKPMLLDFTAVWCKPCLAMDKEFWVLNDVAKAVKPFIAVKLDFDNEKSLAAKYGTTAIPYVVFTDPLGNMVTFRRGFGSKNVSELNLIFSEMPKDFSALLPAYEAIETNKNNGVAWLQIADAYRGANMIRLSCDFYKKALNTADIQNNAETKERIMATIGIGYYSIKDHEYASDALGDYIKAFPQGKNRETILYAFILTKANLRKFKDADKYFEQFKTEFPASKRIDELTKVIETAKSKKDKN
jgi:thiol-disulfide isomerase/thioredoxin